MTNMLDAMEELMTGAGATFDRTYYEKLTGCMEQFDAQLPASQIGGWSGIAEHWKAEGASTWGTAYGVAENNETQTTFLDMTIHEPCNYASNIAYYHVVTELCDRKNSGSVFNLHDDEIVALIQSFSSLVISSSFFHGSTTYLGLQQDLSSISVFSFVIYQIIISPLQSDSSIINDISASPRPETAIKLAESFRDMHLSTPVQDWRSYTQSKDIIPFMNVFAGVITAVTALLTPELLDIIIKPLAEAFGLHRNAIAFIMDEYLPEIKRATENVTISIADKLNLLSKVQGTTIKFVYSFLWQEDIVDALDSFIFQPIVNMIGNSGLSVVNTYANTLSNFQYFEDNFQIGHNIYPGDFWCNDKIPHAKWHLESAIALLDMIYLADEIRGVLQ